MRIQLTMPLTGTPRSVPHPTALVTTPTPSSQTNIPHGTVSLIPTTTTPQVSTEVATESQSTTIQTTITVLRSNNKPSMLTQRLSTEPIFTPLSQSHAPPAGNEHIIHSRERNI